MKICLFGDSVSYASYIKNSWANLLKWHLEDNYPDNIEFFNLGINGNTSSDLLSRFNVEASARLPDQIIFAIGINDSSYIFQTGESILNEVQFVKNISQLVEQARSFTKNITFIGLVLGDDTNLKPYSDTGKAYTRERTKKYDNLLRLIADSKNCNYINLFDKLDFNDFIEGLHPNENGHKKMFEEIKNNFLS